PTSSSIFSFNATAPTELYTLSLHDALPIWGRRRPLLGEIAHCLLLLHPVSAPRTSGSKPLASGSRNVARLAVGVNPSAPAAMSRSEEHTSELQSLAYLVCRLLLEKKKSVRH